MKIFKTNFFFILRGWLSDLKKIRLIDIIKPRAVIKAFRLQPRVHFQANEIPSLILQGKNEDSHCPL